MEGIRFSKTKKGFTLVEMIFVISIILIFLSTAVVNIKAVTSIQNKIDTDLFAIDLINFINSSKKYCRDNKLGCCISFDLDENCITLNYDVNEIDRLDLPRGFKLHSVRTSKEIDIDNRGITSDACSMKFKDRGGKVHVVTMGVGTAYVQIKE